MEPQGLTARQLDQGGTMETYSIHKPSQVTSAELAILTSIIEICDGSLVETEALDEEVMEGLVRAMVIEKQSMWLPVSLRGFSFG